MRIGRRLTPAWRARAEELRAQVRDAEQDELAEKDRYKAFRVLDPSAEWTPEYEEARGDAAEAWAGADTARHELYAFLHPRRYARKGYPGARLLPDEYSPQQAPDLLSQPDPDMNIPATSRPDPGRPRSSAPDWQPGPGRQPYRQAEDPEPEAEDGRSFLAMLPGTADAPRRAGTAIGYLLRVWDLDSLIPDTNAMARELIARAAEATPGRSIGFALIGHTTTVGKPGITCEIWDYSADLPDPAPARAGGEPLPGPATISPHATSTGCRPWACGNKAWFTLTTPDDPAASARITEREPEPEAGA